MKHLKALVMMQLKDKIDFSFLKSKKKTITKIVFTILAFVAITVLCLAFFKVSAMLNLFSLISTVPLSVVVVVFTVMFLLSCVSCTYNLMQKLYFSPDNQVLLTMPVNSNQVFVSKLIVFYIYELLKNFYFMIPVFIAYGIFQHFSILFYPWLIICFLFISALPVLIGAILSIPVMFIASKLKQWPMVRFILFAIILAAVAYAVVLIISVIPADINIIQNWGKIFWRIQDFLTAFTKIFVVFAYIVQMVCGKMVNLSFELFSLTTLYVLLIVLASIVVLFLIAYLLARPLFFKMASKPFEYKKRIIKKNYINKKRNYFRSGINTNLKMSLRNTQFLYNYIGILIVLPISIFLLNKIFTAMNTKLLGTYMTLSFNILLITLIVLSSNVIISSIYSKEGRSSYYFKTTPRTYAKILFPKLIFSLVISFVAIVATIIIFGLFAKLSWLQIIMCVLFIYGLYLGHLFWSAELDLMNPQNEQYATSGNEESNPNETKSTIFAFILALLATVISLLLFIENSNVAWIKLMLMGIVFATIRIYLYFDKIKLYYKEK